jgi:hypothetical protein
MPWRQPSARGVQRLIVILISPAEAAGHCSLATLTPYKGYDRAKNQYYVPSHRLPMRPVLLPHPQR